MQEEEGTRNKERSMEESKNKRVKGSTNKDKKKDIRGMIIVK